MVQVKDKVIEVTIDSLVHGGRGLARHEGVVVFIPGSAPGDRIRARVVNRRKNYLEAEIEEILKPSLHRVDPPHDDPRAFGGCCWHFIDYAEQLRQKRDIVAGALRHIARIQESVDVRPVEPSPELWRYRNKIEMTFGPAEDGGVALGFHAPGSFHDIFDVPVCMIGPEEVDALTAAMRAFARRHDLPPHDPKTHGGLLRHAIFRRASATGETLAILLTKTRDMPAPDELLAGLREACPNLKYFQWGLNAGKADIARIDETLFEWGEGYINEELDGRRYRISGTSFFQTNSPGAEALYRHVREAAALSGRETLFDAYCGTGAIGIYLADQCARVVGIDENKASIWDARVNAQLNDFDHCTFIVGPMRYTLPLVHHAAPGGLDRVVVDPPRSGMDKQSLRQLIGLDLPVFVYVSCNPATMSRDVQAILEAGYRLEYVQPVDLFPHTYHVETVAKFSK